MAYNEDYLLSKINIIYKMKQLIILNNVMNLVFFVQFNMNLVQKYHKIIKYVKKDI